jgi:hypothetical protein
MQWIRPFDEHGPGFALGCDLIELLAELGTLVDVDQFVE